MTTMQLRKAVLLLLLVALCTTTYAFVPLIDGGKELPQLYKCYFNDQLAKQASTALSKCIAAGKRKIEINFPPVPNVEEVRFGTPLNKDFGTKVLAKDLGTTYKPGSDISRNLLSYANIYWAKKLTGSVGGAFGSASVLTAEPLILKEIRNPGRLATIAPLSQAGIQKLAPNSPLFAVNLGGEEIWERTRAQCRNENAPFVVLNNAYSTTYDLGNKKGYEEAYYLKRISKGYIYRAFPGNWEAWLEKPDGSVEKLMSYRQKPSLKEVATIVREESFKRYGLFNERYFGPSARL